MTSLPRLSNLISITSTVFQNEKIVDTKTRLHQLMQQIPEPSGKSLLLQTVALFETLLTKIQAMKAENEGLAADKAGLEAMVDAKAGVEGELETAKKNSMAADEVS